MGGGTLLDNDFLMMTKCDKLSKMANVTYLASSMCTMNASSSNLRKIEDAKRVGVVIRPRAKLPWNYEH
jgi:hypothetical protein